MIMSTGNVARPYGGVDKLQDRTFRDTSRGWVDITRRCHKLLSARGFVREKG